MFAHHTSQHKRSFITLLLALGLALFLMFIVNSAIPVTRAAGPWYVAPPPLGNDANTCSSAAAPCATISAAIGKAAADDTINIASGTYTENVTVTVPLNFIGAGANNTIVDGNSTDRVFTILSGTVSMADLTVQHGNTGGDGGGIYAAGILTLTNVNVLSNTVMDGGGGVSAQQRAYITGSLFQGNRATNAGGGLEAEASLSLSHSRFMNNAAHQGGGIYLGGNSSYDDLSTILLVGNTATSAQGNALFAKAGGVNLTFATIASPTLGDGSAILNQSNWGLSVYDTLVASYTVGYEQAEGASSWLSEDSTLFSGVVTPYLGSRIATGSHSFSGMAGFVDPPDADYHLTASSDAINRILTYSSSVTDLEGNPRPAGCGYDIGSYEYQAAPDCTLTINVVGTGIVTPTVGTHSYAYNATVHLTASTSAPSSFGGWSGDEGSAEYSAEIFMDRNKAVTATFGLPVCYATPDNGLTVESSPNYAALQRAADLASAGGTVKVAGTCAGVRTQDYGDWQTLDLDKSLTLLGGYTVTNWLTSYPLTQPTVLDAQQAGYVISLNAYGYRDLTITDLTIQNGNTFYGGAGIKTYGTLTLNNVNVMSNTTLQSGGGVLIRGSATITGGVFQNNRALTYEGGSIYVSGDLTLTNVNVISNTAIQSGGGVWVERNATITGGVFQNNRSLAQNGGGLVVRESLNLTGTRFTNNTAQRGGGLYLGGVNGSVSSLANIILTKNTATSTQGNALFADSGTVILRHGTLASPTLGNGSAIYGYANDWTIYSLLIANYAVGYEQAEGSSGGLYEYRTLFSDVITPYVGSRLISDSHSFSGVAGFADPISGDYHLTASSEAINRGTEMNPPITTDFDGNLRPVGCGYDIGAYEYQAAPACMLTIGIVGTGIVTPTAGVHSYPYGAVVPLTASTSAPWSFAGWSGDVTSPANSASVYMLGDQSVVATFVAHRVYLPLVLK